MARAAGALAYVASVCDIMALGGTLKAVAAAGADRSREPVLVPPTGKLPHPGSLDLWLSDARSGTLLRVSKLDRPKLEFGAL